MACMHLLFLPSTPLPPQPPTPQQQFPPPLLPCLSQVTKRALKGKPVEDWDLRDARSAAGIGRGITSQLLALVRTGYALLLQIRIVVGLLLLA